MASEYDALLEPPVATGGPSEYDALLSPPSEYDALLSDAPSAPQTTHPDRLEERGTTLAREKTIANRSPELQSRMDELDVAKQKAAGLGELLSGTMLDPQNAYIADPSLTAAVGADALAAGGFNPGKLNLDAFKVPEGAHTQEALADAAREPIFQLPTKADPNIPAGIANAVANTASGLTSPENVALLTGMGVAPKAIQRLASLGFSATMIKDAVEQLSQSTENEKPGETAQRVTQGVLTLILGGMAGKHGLERTPISAAERAVSMEAAAERLSNAGARPGAAPTIPEQSPPEAAPAPTSSVEKGEAGTARSTTEPAPVLAEGVIETSAEGTKAPAAPGQEPLPVSGEGAPGRGALEEGSKATGWKQAALPEELRTTPELEEALSGAKEAAPSERAPMRELDTSTGGALGGGGGKPIVNPKGSTPKGDPNFIRVESAPKRLFKGLLTEGAADVLAKTKNKIGQLLSKQIRKHVDVEQELTGKLTAELDRATKGMSKSDVKAAITELEPYLAAKENRRPLPTLSKNAQSLLTAWENIAEQTGLISEAHNVQVFDPTTGGYRPMHRIGRAYVPRMFKPEVQRVLSDPRSDPKLFNDLANALAAHRGITPEAAATELRGVAGRFQASDFMGNLEMARTGQLPEIFYDYNLGNLTSRYLPGFTERMSQIISFGQRLGPRESPSRPNLWDVAMKEAEDAGTQHWLRAAEDQSANLRAAAGPGKVAQQGQTIASGLLLSSPTTTVFRNLLSGVAATTEILGVRRSLAALFKTISDSSTKANAKEIGAIRENIGEFMHADQLGQSRADELIRGATNTALKWSGYNASENFVRTHAAVTASQFAKDAVASLAKDPTSGRSKEALGLFKRTGVDAEKIVAENADWKTGAETRKFIRTVIRDSQGGYRYDMVPLWSGSTAGRLLYQYGRYGVQRARNIWKNGIQPLIGEEVQWHGKTMVRRDARPILKMGASAILLGEAFALAANGFFGRDRKDASVQEITQALSEDQKEGAMMAIDRLTNDIIMAGSFGIYGQPLDAAKAMKDKGRFRNPAEPPSLASVKAVAKLTENAIDQGGVVTNRDLLSFLGNLAPGVKQLSDVARNVFDEPLYEAENDVRTLRTSAARWAAANKLDVPQRVTGDMRKSANAPTYEPIQEALLVGNASRAKFLATQFIKDEKDKSKASAALRSSVKGRQPFRVGPFTSGEHREDFMKWAASHLPKGDYEQAKRVQDRYESAARAAGLW